MHRKYRHEFEVSGTGCFPLDMLRYDSCHPVTTADCTMIHESISEGATSFVSGPRRIVQLEKLTTGKEPEITRGRWRSFGWQVTETAMRTYKL